MKPGDDGIATPTLITAVTKSRSTELRAIPSDDATSQALTAQVDHARTLKATAATPRQPFIFVAASRATSATARTRRDAASDLARSAKYAAAPAITAPTP